MLVGDEKAMHAIVQDEDIQVEWSSSKKMGVIENTMSQEKPCSSFIRTVFQAEVTVVQIEIFHG